MKTYTAKPADIKKNWYVVDAGGKTLGRLATAIATILQGKHKPMYTQHIDTGDYVIVTNASKIKVTGKKMEDKLYRRHTGYIGGLKEIKLVDQLNKKPEFVIEHAVKGMMPKGRLGRQMFKKLKVYAGDSYPHEAQTPTVLEI